MAWKGPRRAFLSRLGKATAIDGVIEWADEATTCYPTACQTLLYEGEAPTTVMPNIMSIAPPNGPAGNPTTVTITGSGFGANPTINTGLGITATITSQSDSTIVATFAIAINAPPGNQPVTVTASAQTSNSVTFFVQVPGSLSIVQSTNSISAEATCTTGGLTGCGVTRAFTYQVNDQTGAPLQVGGYEVWDAIVTTSPNGLNLASYNTTCSPANTNSGPCGIATNNLGQFQELSLGACAPVCFSNNACVLAGPTNANQTWHVGPSSIVQSIGYYCSRVTVNGQ